MRRLARHLVTALAGLSLLLCVAAGVLWARSQSRQEGIVARRGVHLFGVESAGGEVGFRWETDASAAVTPMRPLRPGEIKRFSSVPGAVPVVRKPSVGMRHWTLGLAHDDYDQIHAYVVPGGQASTRIRLLAVPHWLLVLALALPPGAVTVKRVIDRRRRARLVPDACPGCGYDLRATPSRCPECGRVRSGGVAAQ